jgi:hypothetical protein
MSMKRIPRKPDRPDRSRCKAQIGELMESDIKQVENKIKQLFFLITLGV